MYWCPSCALEGADLLCPSPKFHASRVREDVGWRVGNHRGDYSYYASLDSAMQDRRVR